MNIFTIIFVGSSYARMIHNIMIRGNLAKLLLYDKYYSLTKTYI